ncbi:MAG: hypothetical protein ACI88H_001363 [Cocleimonas sp.]|jgi:hypothetical protein
MKIGGTRFCTRQFLTVLKNGAEIILKCLTVLKTVPVRAILRGKPSLVSGALYIYHTLTLKKDSDI